MDEPRYNSRRRIGYLNAVLTVIAVLLGLLVVDGRLNGSTPAQASAAQPDDPSASGQALVSASEQRKQMIAELRRISSRMDRLESKISAGISVKVTEMPSQRTDGK